MSNFQMFKTTINILIGVASLIVLFFEFRSFDIVSNFVLRASDFVSPKNGIAVCFCPGYKKQVLTA